MATPKVNNQYVSGDLLSATRKVFGLTQKQCASLTFVDTSTWQRYEYGKRRVKYKFYVRFVKEAKIYLRREAHDNKK